MQQNDILVCGWSLATGNNGASKELDDPVVIFEDVIGKGLLDALDRLRLLALVDVEPARGYEYSLLPASVCIRTYTSP
jgi:hypothetical protein